MSVGVVIVAAGRGERLGGDVPKQLLDIGGRTMLRRAIAIFDGHPDVAEIVVVLPPDLVARGASIAGAMTRPCGFIGGGARRQDSVRHGVGALSDAVDLILIHDAARPFAGRAVVDRVIAGARADGAAVPAIQAPDTVKQVDSDASHVARTLPRAGIRLAQTPQGFRRAVLEAALRLGEDAADATDEAMLVERGGRPVRIVEGDPGNWKVTTMDDLSAARRRVMPVPRVGTGYDLHRLVAGRTLVLAGVVLSRDVGPESHSDGDVVCHALVDALLGAAGAGDIGRHFPNTDARWKDAPGLDLLARAMAIVAERGFGVGNADVTVVLERPKLAPHVDAIAGAIAAVLGIDPHAVNVKGKTSEGVDAVGRGEAIVAHAVAVLVAGAPA